MLGNCDKMALVITPPKMTNNQWPHPQSTTDDDEIDDSHNNKVVSNSSSSMEKPRLQQQQVALKCPRCDSANTKFCYYNNYSLSQPRHFCKACKRYWTRGGTLRNVPVGGGCRKNKHQRLKRPSTSSSSTTIDSATPPSSEPQSHQIDAIASTSNHHINPWFYGLADNPACDVNLPLFSSRYSSSRVSSCSGLFDLIQPQMNALGIGLSRGVMSSDNGLIRNNEFTSNNNNNNSMLFPSSYSSIFASSSSSSSTTPDMMPINSSLLGSNLMMMQQQKLMNVGVKDDGPVGRNNTNFHDQGRIEQVQRMAVISGDNDDLHSGSGCGVGAAASKDVKVELGHNRLLELWNNNNGASGTTTSTATAANNFQNQIQHHVMTFSDPNSFHWNSTAEAADLGSSGANWNDQPNNIGPSVTSLI